MKRRRLWRISTPAVVPGHNGRLPAKHTWNDPLIQLARASKDKNYRLLTPELGEPVRVSDTTQVFSRVVGIMFKREAEGRAA